MTVLVVRLSLCKVVLVIDFKGLSINLIPATTVRGLFRGFIFWQAYNPMTGRSACFGSEAEMRMWIEMQYYQEM